MRRCAICGAKATGTGSVEGREMDTCIDCGLAACDWFVEWLP